MCEARFFDGETSQPQRVIIKIENDDTLVISFNDTQHSKRFSFSTIKCVEKLNNEYKIEFKSPEPSLPGELLLFLDNSFYLKLLKLWKNDQSFIKTSIISFDNISIFKKVAIGGSVVAIFILLFYISITNVYRVIPIKYDIHIGNKIEKQFLKAFEYGESDLLNDFIKRVDSLLYDSSDIFDIDIKIVNHKTVNAIALPGGKIIVFKGLIEKSESPEEVIGIIAHEIEHVQQRHTTQQIFRSIGFALLSSLLIGMVLEGVEIFESLELITEIASTLILLKYSRGFEKEADLGSIKRMQDRKLTVKGMLHFFNRLEKEKLKGDSTVDTSVNTNTDTLSQKKKHKRGFKKKLRFPSFISTHPGNQERIKYLQDALLQENDSSHECFSSERENWDSIKTSIPKIEKKKGKWELLFPKVRSDI